MFNLLVIRARNPDRLVEFYQALGMEFTKEKHGNGPQHLACEVGGFVFEIYPLLSETDNTRGTRLGLNVDSISEILSRLNDGRHALPTRDEIGRLSVVLTDPEGHKVHLVENQPAGSLALKETFRMPDQKYAAFDGAIPYFNLVRGALGDLVDGEHFFDIVAEDIAYEVLYDFPGWPRVIRGRTGLMDQFRGYVDNIALQAADKLIIHKADSGGTIIIEYEIHGTILGTGAKYNNRFCSIIRIDNRKIAHWRDYMDSLAAWNALTGKGGT